MTNRKEQYYSLWILLHFLLGNVYSLLWVLEPSIHDGLSIAGRITTRDTRSIGQCIVECKMNPKCITVGFCEQEAACQLYDLDLQNHTNMIIQASTIFLKSVCNNQEYTYVRHLNKCIKRLATPTNFMDARSECQLDGGDLMTVKTNEARLYLQDIMLEVTMTTKYWIGATQTAGNNSDWTWVDDSTMTQSNGWYYWAEGEPSDVTQECVQIASIYGGDVFFLDKDCNNTAGVLCETLP